MLKYPKHTRSGEVLVNTTKKKPDYVLHVSNKRILNVIFLN